MRGIKGRLTASFIIVILISVVGLEVLLIYTIQQNYYGSLKGNLTSQVQISADMYSKYYSEASLEENIMYNVDAFWNQSNARVEIIDANGNIIMDSLGIIPGPGEPMEDVYAALDDKTGEWIGVMDGSNVMAVAYPLKSSGEIVGALRLIASTDAIDIEIQDIIKILIAIGFFVVFTVGLISLFLANSILVPLKKVTAAAKEMADGNFLARSVTKRNDEIGKLSDTLNYMADEIIKKEALKNEFISSVSHELRTPLTSILGWAITLQSKELRAQETLDDGLSIIAGESERLTHMVDELLDFSRFTAGGIRLECKVVNLSDLLLRIKKQLSPRAERENIEFTLSFREDLPDIRSDANRLKQLFINILDNALNFTEAGGTVHFQAAYKNNMYIFTITDSGCGIPPNELPLVKEKFFKGSGAGSKNGIGLSICEEIVTLMGGCLDLKSQVGAGTVVTVKLPREAPSND
jgi:signal transduction histidine kinase